MTKRPGLWLRSLEPPCWHRKNSWLSIFKVSLPRCAQLGHFGDTAAAPFFNTTRHLWRQLVLLCLTRLLQRCLVIFKPMNNYPLSLGNYIFHPENACTFYLLTFLLILTFTFIFCPSLNIWNEKLLLKQKHKFRYVKIPCISSSFSCLGYQLSFSF